MMGHEPLILLKPLVRGRWSPSGSTARRLHPDREIGIGIVRVADEAADLMTDRVPG